MLNPIVIGVPDGASAKATPQPASNDAVVAAIADANALRLNTRPPPQTIVNRDDY
jgi:hypothetical protein